MKDYDKVHFKAAKSLLMYLNGTKNVFLHLRGKRGVVEYADSDWGGYPLSRNSTGGYVFLYGGTAFSWKLSSILSLRLPVLKPSSSTEAEYEAHSQAVEEALWIRGILNELKET